MRAVSRLIATPAPVSGTVWMPTVAMSGDAWSFYILGAAVVQAVLLAAGFQAGFSCVLPEHPPRQ